MGEFDWVGCKNRPYEKPMPESIIAVGESETLRERKMRMLLPLQSTCTSCSMCELGIKPAVKGDIVRDPHVFSNMNPSRFMVVGQNPGWNELKVNRPFVGAAGKNWDTEIGKHGLSRDDFYICNAVRCFTTNNMKPSEKHKKRCEPFLKMEINLLRPKFVVTLGAVAFSQFCPDGDFSGSLKKIVHSKPYDVHVFPIYHPSPVNFRSPDRKTAFEEQIKLLCMTIKKIRESEDEGCNYD